MRFDHKSKSIRQIVAEIKSGSLDLEPNFQRGEVWSLSKKQRLVDSILRGWYIPPIHLVKLPGHDQKEVLDGQQRLRAIVEFADDFLSVDAAVDPEDRRFDEIHGLTYSNLPRRYREKFDSFKISIFTLSKYKPTEPGELFFRLNQPATLTTAEQRNAFYGKARDQVKQWVNLLRKRNVNKSVLGFDNKRMAYDDTLARVAFSVEVGSLTRKVTADDLVVTYRSPEGYSTKTDERIRRAIDIFAGGTDAFGSAVRFNKATLYSWLIFIVRANDKIERIQSSALSSLFGQYVSEFAVQLSSVFEDDDTQKNLWPQREERRLLYFYQSRATSRVADVSSVILRDVVIWILLSDYLRTSADRETRVLSRQLRRELEASEEIYQQASRSSPFDEDALEAAAMERNWGALS